MLKNLNKESKHAYVLNHTELDACVALHVYNLTACFFYTIYAFCLYQSFNMTFNE